MQNVDQEETGRYIDISLRDGFTSADISQETGISVQSIRRYRRNMAKYDSIRAPKRHRPRKLDVEQEEVRSRTHRRALFYSIKTAFFDALLIKGPF